MLHRYGIWGVLASTLMVVQLFLSPTNSWARTTNQSSSQTGCTDYYHSLGLCSIEVNTYLTGLKNESVNPSAATVSVSITDGEIFSWNPGGGGGGLGVPFGGISVTLVTSSVIDSAEVTHNGRFEAITFFHDAELLASIRTALIEACDSDNMLACATLESFDEQVTQHPNWIHTTVVTHMIVTGIQWTDPDTDDPSCNLESDPVVIDEGACTLTDALQQDCNAPAAVIADPASYVFVEFDYVCEEVCHLWNGDICPPEG